MKKTIRIYPSKDKQWDASFWAIPGWQPDKIAAAKVMVVGAGALGNEVVKNLTLLNIGHLLVVDFDVVEYNNLAKSIMFRMEDRGKKKAEVLTESAKSINPSIKTHYINGDIGIDVGLGVFRRMDVVIGCLDNRQARLSINRQCFKVNKSWVDGGLENLAGNFSVYTPGISCYECGLTELARSIIDFRKGCPDIAKRNDTFGSIATTPIASSIIGAFQVQEALKIIFGNTENSMAGEGFRYNGMNNFFLQYKEAELHPDCDSHISYDQIIEARGLSHNNTVAEVLNWLEKELNTSTIKILPEEEIVLSCLVNEGQERLNTAVFKSKLLEIEAFKQLKVSITEDVPVENSISYIDRSFIYPDRTLKDIGFPFLDILKVDTDDDIFLVELTGDEDLLAFH